MKAQGAYSGASAPRLSDGPARFGYSVPLNISVLYVSLYLAARPPVGYVWLPNLTLIGTPRGVRMRILQIPPHHLPVSESHQDLTKRTPYLICSGGRRARKTKTCVSVPGAIVRAREKSARATLPRQSVANCLPLAHSDRILGPVSSRRAPHT
eukprot:2736684-Pleurochrysis_carterae.AAC.1